MAEYETRIELRPSFFDPMERRLVEHGGLSAATFRYSTGVDAVRLRNGAGSLVILPFQGQQIWSAEFGGRDLTMKSMFAKPNATREYLQTYGGFLLHCGMTAMGVPAEGDSHPLHGELPNAPYQSAYVVVGADEGGEYIGVGGAYRHTVAFSVNYVAEPLVKMYAGAPNCRVMLTVQNLKKTPMEFMYMAHVNFRPVDNGRLVYSAHCTPEHVRVRKSIPSHVHPGPGYREYLEELELHPERHNVLAPELTFDPEVVFSIDYLADDAGWAHSMQVHPDGSADYIRHRPEQLDKGVRWICRTPDQDALGIVLPSTAEPEGYSAEKAKGNIKILPAGGVFVCGMEAGALTADEAKALAAHIEAVVAAG
jgi:hypothetical protein